MAAVLIDDLDSPDQRERRRRILDAATALASRGGFEQVRMRSVADRADVALGTLYRYFPSKVHLLVCVLGQRFETTRESFERRPPVGDTPADRVMVVLGRTTRALQRDPHLTEALVRAFMFADASVAAEISAVGREVTAMLAGALREPGEPVLDPTAEQVAITRVIGDVWLSSLVQWVTGRASADDVSRSLDVAVRLLVR